MLKNIAFIFLLFLLPIVGTAEEDVNVEEEVSTLSFELHSGLMLFKVQVEGKEKAFLLDSGAPSIIINRKVRRSQAVFSTIEGDISASQGELKEIRIGHIHRTSVPIWNMDLSHIERRLGVRVDGLIGAEILNSHDLLINYKLQKISFLPSGRLNDLKPRFSRVVALPFVSHFDNLPVVEVNHNGKRLKMGFDTGAGISVISEDLINGEEVLDEISLGSLKVHSLPFIANNDMSKFSDEIGNELDGILSVNSLNADFVLISSSKKSIYLFWDATL